MHAVRDDIGLLAFHRLLFAHIIVFAVYMFMIIDARVLLVSLSPLLDIVSMCLVVLLWYMYRL